MTISRQRYSPLSCTLCQCRHEGNNYYLIINSLQIKNVEATKSKAPLRMPASTGTYSAVETVHLKDKTNPCVESRKCETQSMQIRLTIWSRHLRKYPCDKCIFLSSAVRSLLSETALLHSSYGPVLSKQTGVFYIDDLPTLAWHWPGLFASRDLARIFSLSCFSFSPYELSYTFVTKRFFSVCIYADIEAQATHSRISFALWALEKPRRLAPHAAGFY